MVQGLSSAPNASVVQTACTATGQQGWRFRQVASNWQVYSNETGLCLMPSGGSTSAGAALVQGTCTTDTNRLWTLRGNADGSTSVIGAASGLCIDLPGGGGDGSQLRQAACAPAGSTSQNWRIVTARNSSWTAPSTLPLVPVAAAMMPSGEMLVWSAEEKFAFATGVTGRTYTAVYNPTTGVSTEALVTQTGHDMFCPGISLLPNGNVFVTGGGDSARTSIYDPFVKGWVAGPDMNVGRGYAASVTMPDGSVFTVGGSWSGAIGGKIGERWSSSTNQWSMESGVSAEVMSDNDPGGIFRADNHMWLFTASNRWVFQAGPGHRMHWIDTNGSGNVYDAGARSDDAYAINGNAVMYDAWKILTVGGAPAYEGGYGTRNAYQIDISGGGNVAPPVRKLSPMSYSRTLHNSVVLPNGQVVVVGGMAYSILFSDDQAVMAPELWDPATETFMTMKPMQVPRTYHSFALLLPDARVIVGGGGLCGACAANHPDVEVLTPPYLLNGDGSPATRPTIASAPATASAGGTITVGTGSAVASFALVRLGTGTHSVNTDQRRIPLSIVGSTGGANPSYSLSVPSDTGLMVPGYYYLFAMNANGVPSVARTVRIN